MDRKSMFPQKYPKKLLVSYSIYGRGMEDKNKYQDCPWSLKCKLAEPGGVFLSLLLLFCFLFAGGGGSFTRCLFTSKLNLSSYAIGTRWTHILQMHLLFASSRINITILDEQQLEGLHVVAFLMGSQDEITCVLPTVSNGEEKYIPL